VVGDGHHNLERLILADERAMRQARLFLRRHAANLMDVPAAGEVVPLGQLGNHCQGAVFLEGAHLETERLRAAVDRLTRGYQGFYLGRYDFRAPSWEHIRRGELLTAIELNGVSSEATNIYDPANGLRQAYRILGAQWRLIFEIAAANRELGHQPMSTLGLLKRISSHLMRHRRLAQEFEAGTPHGAEALAK